MSRTLTTFFVAAFLAVLTTAVPGTASIIPAGEDRWVTPADGNTFFTFPEGDVESLCGAEVDFGWDRTVMLTGDPEAGEDWDTVIVRLEDLDVSRGSASVPVQVRNLALKSLEILETPCGLLRWRISALRHQPVTKMRIHNTSGKGGRFEANLSAKVAFQAIDAEGTPLGLLFYNLELPSARNTSWSFDEYGFFRPGIDEKGKCSKVLQENVGPLPAQHSFYIEAQIAEDRCSGAR